MNRWKTMFVSNWLPKLVSLAVATLLWLAIRHAMMPSATGPVPAVEVAPWFH